MKMLQFIFGLVIVIMFLLMVSSVSAFDIIPVGTVTDSVGDYSLDSPTSIFVSGDYIYTASYTDDTFAIWNISAHGNPIGVGTKTDSDGADTLDGVRSVYVLGDYAYTISNIDATLVVWNISLHGNPVFVGSVTNSLLAGGYYVVADGDYAYVVSNTIDTVSVWNISLHGNPTLVGNVTDSVGDYSIDDARTMAISGDYLYVGSYADDTLSVWNISLHSDPIPVGTVTDSSGDYSMDEITSVVVEGDYAYVSCYTGRTLSVWNISLHGNPIPVGTYTSTSGNDTLDLVRSISVSGDYLYTISYNDDTWVAWNISAHGNPVPVGSYTDSAGDYSVDGGHSIFVSEGYVYTTSFNDETMAVFNVTQPSIGNNAPVWTETINNVSINSSQNLSIQFNCTDADSDPLTYGDNTSLWSINGSGYVFDDPNDGTDIGNHSIQINCSDGTDTITMNFTYEVWNGSITSLLNITWLNPLLDDNHTQYTFKNYTFNVTCISGNCGNVNVTLDPTIQLQNVNNESLGDTYIDEHYPDTNYGTNQQLYVQQSSTSGWNKYALLKFNISSIPPNSIITNATLYLYTDLNGLDNASEGFNISAHHIYHNYSGCPNWNETCPTWNLRPNSTEYNTTKESDYYFFGGEGETYYEWLSWEVTNMVSIEYLNGYNNISIYLIAHDYFGSPSTSDFIYIDSRNLVEPTNLHPYLNITYSTLKSKNTINNTAGATPFYHNGTTINYECGAMNNGDSCTTTFWVNATGDINDTYEFYATASSDDGDVSSINSSIINITIVSAAPPPDTCTCTDPNWEIDLADHCNITTTCEISGILNFTASAPTDYVSFNTTINASTITFSHTQGKIYIRSNGKLNEKS